MFLSRRATQAEYFDSERPLSELRAFSKELARLNRTFRAHQLFIELLPRLLKAQNCRTLTMLDVGSGDCSLGNTVRAWAARRDWKWEVLSLDSNVNALSLASADTGPRIAGSAFALPFPDAAIDVVIASQMTHHLEPAQIALHFREAWRVARKAVLVCDLHRNAALLLFLRVYLPAARYSRLFQEDAFLSVRRAWRARELTRFALEAGIAGARVRNYFGARLILHAVKPELKA